MRIAVCWKEGPAVPKKWDLVIEDQLNVGSTCSVHKGRYGTMEVAVKCVKGRDCRNEIESLCKLKDEACIVHLYDFRTQIKETILLTELCKGGDLIDHVLALQSAGRLLDEADVKYVVSWLLGAVKRCHDHGIAHLDIKLDNIGLGAPNDFKTLKLLDFGNSRPLTDEKHPTKDVAGTFHYLAPELLTRRYISGASSLRKLDIWAVGVVAYSLLQGAFPFGNVKDIVNFKFRPKSDPTRSKESAKFVYMLLTPAAARPGTVSECMSHEWLTGGPA